VLTYEQAERWVEALSPRVVFPMHYRIPGVSRDQITGIGTVTEWLSRLPAGTGPVLLETDTIVLGDGPGARPLPPPGTRQVWRFRLPHERQETVEAEAPGHAEAQQAKQRGEVAVAEGDLSTALAQFTRAAALEPNDADLLMKIGLLHLGGSRPDLALEFLQRAAALSEENDAKRASLCWLGSGMALDLMKRREEALEAYRKVIAIGVNDEQQTDQARGYLRTPYGEE